MSSVVGPSSAELSATQTMQFPYAFVSGSKSVPSLSWAQTHVPVSQAWVEWISVPSRLAVAATHRLGFSTFGAGGSAGTRGDELRKVGPSLFGPDKEFGVRQFRRALCDRLGRRRRSRL